MSHTPTPDHALLPVPPARTSKAALFSFICGLVFCIPFLTGVLAILLGIVGFFTAGKPGMKGRWMAIVGGVLGTISIVVWAFSIGAVIAVTFSAMGMFRAPANASNEFIRDLSLMPMADLELKYGQFSGDSLDRLKTLVNDKGTFVDTTFPTIEIKNNDAKVRGTAKFTNATLPVEVELRNVDGNWKITSIDFDPDSP